MKQILNGFQCEKCNSIYDTENKAIDCEKNPIESPLLKIGDSVIDNSYGVEKVVIVFKIYFIEHEACYRMKWKDSNENGDSEGLFTINGNDFLTRNYIINL
ncbi:hypothetical protein M3649_19200 [Ureibacillus chungkukjangi]|uniref:hypothetical protein n=1 Tax=Ureibacillus chungkukjangi TaxID=1202712 RepID=UPI00203B7BCD|nr:hypothetical protein [Ureibacillus chungkukjangi]MCM3390228.1 hypothetical protein [Ureibacillus chungkukjangi]